MQQNKFLNGIKDGLPICFGYFSVAFAFGIFAVGSGFKAIEAILISMANVTSAGQLAAVPIIAGGGTLLELATCQFVINLRYSLMSISLSQRMDKSITLFDRFVLAFCNTDEVFAVATVKPFLVTRQYMYGLITTPYIGWALGTAVGAFAGRILPEVVISALGVAIYGMFVAIVVPDAKKSRPTLLAVLFAMVLGLIFYYVPVINTVPTGFKIIICGVVASTVMAILKPIEPEVMPYE